MYFRLEEDSKLHLQHLICSTTSELKIENIFTYHENVKYELDEDIKTLPQFSTVYVSSLNSTYSNFKKRNPFHGMRRKKSRRCRDPLRLSAKDVNVNENKELKLPVKLQRELDVTLPALFCEMPLMVDNPVWNGNARVKMKQEPGTAYGSTRNTRRKNLRRSLVANDAVKRRRFTIWYPCGECHMKFPCSRLLIHHVIKDHPYFYCKQCREFVNNRKLLRKHFNVHYKGVKAPYKCDECSVTYKHMMSLIYHKEKHLNWKLPQTLIMSYNVKIDPDEPVDQFNDAASTTSSSYDDDYDRLSFSAYA